MENIKIFIKELQNTKMSEPEVGWASYAGIHQNEGTETYERKLETLYNGFTEEFMEIFLNKAPDCHKHIGNYVLERLKICNDIVILNLPSSLAIEQVQCEAATATYLEDKKKYKIYAERLMFFRDMIHLQIEYANRAKRFVQERCFLEPDVNEVKSEADGSHTPTHPFDMSELYHFLINEGVIKKESIDEQLFKDCITHARMNALWEISGRLRKRNQMRCVFNLLHTHHYERDWIECVAKNLDTKPKKIYNPNRETLGDFEKRLRNII